MDAELTALAQAGAAAVVTAMTTDLWQSTRDTVIGLFQRADRSRQTAIEAQLDGNAALVRDSAIPDDVRRTLFGLWVLELTELLRQDPSCREPLTRLADEADRAFPADRPLVSFGQTNAARDSGRVFAVQHGDLHACNATHSRET
ncbi:hypothetical protein [Streptomyces sp. NBC_01408]|uniref:hypothetical protein n=1 Tax=Streptomyces sp. NBC_01408 TaxID=2903855 RepID=UPI00224E46A3|nr:hypothetical protein [Streptomyces sp. NBC_01408]MCX4693662.1 hypothetical protein [Streptomyces sp. NBC_01408]